MTRYDETPEDRATRLTGQLARLLDAVSRHAPAWHDPPTYPVGIRCPECAGRGWQPGPVPIGEIYSGTEVCACCCGTGRIGADRDEIAQARARRSQAVNGGHFDPTDTRDLRTRQNINGTNGTTRATPESTADRRVADVNRVLDRLGAGPHVTRRAAREALRDVDFKCPNLVLDAALAARKLPRLPHGQQGATLASPVNGTNGTTGTPLGDTNNGRPPEPHQVAQPGFGPIPGLACDDAPEAPAESETPTSTTGGHPPPPKGGDGPPGLWNRATPRAPDLGASPWDES